VGGKGANLARLTRAGFSVPPGFIITTDVYHDFVEANKIADPIHAALAGLSLGDSLTLEQASQTIRSAFSSGALPPGLKTAISEAYAALRPSSAEPQPVAVRSSATAEDLPDLSFAGQQDTFLNVIGEAQLLKAVVDCWSSLWTGRAIGYRLRNGIRQDEAALAVVVQVMVPSEVSGVMFVNPLTGLRGETVIDATFGWGKRWSRQLEPDHYVADSPPGRLSRGLGQKKLSTRSRIGGGVEL
jgi:pyruvate,water dikinase